MSKPEKTIEFALEKSEFKKLIKSHHAFAQEKSSNHILGAINFKIATDEDKLICASTDGYRLLKTELDVIFNSIETTQIEFNFPADFLSKIKLQKGRGVKNGDCDLITITLGKSSISIFDEINKISYEMPSIEEKFPNYEDLIPNYGNDVAYTIGVNLRFFKDLKNFDVSSRTNLLTLTFNKESELSPILINSKRDGVKSQALLMPIEIKNTTGQ